MSYTTIITISKTADSPANAFDTMPVLPTIGTVEQIDAFKAAYPSEWSQERTSDKIVMTAVYASQEIWDTQQLDPLAIALKDARAQWAAENHIEFDLKKF